MNAVELIVVLLIYLAVAPIFLDTGRSSRRGSERRRRPRIVPAGRL